VADVKKNEITPQPIPPTFLKSAGKPEVVGKTLTILACVGMSICGISLLLAKGCGKPNAQPQQVASIPVFTYEPQPRYCENHAFYDSRYDFSKDNRDVIIIVLQDGCYADRRILPEAWGDDFLMQMSQNPGDYVSVFCTEHRKPTRAFVSYGQMSGLFSGCFIPQRRESDGTIIPSGSSIDFSPQGRGTLTLTRLTTRALPPPKSLFPE
jgi:hypothetical protein